MDRRTILGVVCILAICHRTASQGTSPPKIVNQSPSPFVVPPKIVVEIECEATGVPAPTYQWQKDGADVPMDNKYSMNGGNLVVKRPTEMTDGEYRCIAKNQYGVAISNKINLAVAYFGPFAETEPETFVFNEGQVASIPCNDQPSLPAATVFWTDDANPGNKIVLDNRVSVDPDNNLRFSNIRLGDKRKYQCNVKNEMLRVQILSPVKEVVVNAVENIPTRVASFVYTPPSNVIAFRTKKLRLKCMAEGYPTPTITWQKKDESLPDDRTSYESYNLTLVISDVVAGDAGVYECTAQNNDVPTMSTVTVTVKSEPYWINKPEDVNLVIKDNGDLLCEAGGIPLPTISWLINGVLSDSPDAEKSDRVTITGGTGNGLVHYVNAETEDSAVFQCIAFNEYGEIAASGFVNVESTPAELTQVPPANKLTIEGKGFTLSCSGQGSPKPVVTWLFKGTEIPASDDRFHSTTTGNSATVTSTLTASDLTRNDTGRYTCSMSNGFGAVEGASTVNVRKGTKIIKGGDKVTAVKDTNAIIPCEVDHDESLDVTVTWHRDLGDGLQNLDLGARFRFASSNSYNLRISQVVVEDSGTYECKASTAEDHAAINTELVVQTSPDPPTKPTVTPRSDVSDRMVALAWDKSNNGNSPITNYIVYYKTDWADLGSVKEATVNATQLSPQLSLDLSPWVNYRFHVVAVNAIGKSAPSQSSDDYETDPAKPSKAPADVQIKPTDPGKMLVSWPEVHPYNQDGPGFKYVVQWKEKGATEWTTEKIDNYKTTSFEIDGGDNYKELEVQVFYENDVAPGPETAQSGFTGEGTPTDAPLNVKVEAEGPADVLITWDTVPESSVNGRLQSFLVYFERQDALAQGQKPRTCTPNTDCRIGGLSPYQTYGFQVAVKNGQRIGPKSEMVTLTMPEGPPGIVYDLTVDALSDRLHVKWGKPVFPNGVITSYNVSYRSFKGDDLGPETVVPIRDPGTTSYVVDPANPETNYRVRVFAINGAGKGAEDDAEIETRAGGAPAKPILVFSQIEAGKHHINVTFVQPAEGAAANQFYVQFKEAGDEEAVYEDTKPVDLLDQNKIMVSDLKPGTEYKLQLVATNDKGETKGAEQTAKTTGTDPQVAKPIYVQGWFIALLIIIVALLCILLVLCILKSQRGGKYNVSDKEQQRKGDIETTPLKDKDGFEEFAPHKDTPDGELPRGSQGSLKDSEPGSSDTDSLKEYADGELGKFNEEGSFIGQYGDKKQRPAEDAEQGGAAYSTFV